jgi:hypothetical protein
MGGKLIPTAVFITLLGVVACSGSSSDDSSDPAPVTTQAPGQSADNAQGWQTIDMIADQAETKLDSLGHFDTSRNACGHEAFGILDLALWNNIVDESNRALTMPALSDDHLLCFDNPDGNRMDGTVDFILVSPSSTIHSEESPEASPTPSRTVSASPSPTPTVHPSPTPSVRPSASPSPSPSPSNQPKRSIFEVRGGQICTTIQDQQLAVTLLQNISTFVGLADKQDCPNGYGN